jgi:Ca2+-binding EF-hand superfamily protein
MAENKKSFIAYADWKNTFDELPNEEAGKLIKHIFAYVNDESPVSESILINAVFANIKTTLKRDLDKWQTQLSQRVEAGKKSAELRATKSSERSTVVESRLRNPTDSVSVSVNDNVILEPKVLSDFEKTFEDFRSMRNKIRKPMTQKAEELVLSKLQKMCGSNELLKIKLLNQSIINCWQDIYDIKIEKQQNKIDTPDITKIQKY